mgnify:CR=1 FL=1
MCESVQQKLGHTKKQAPSIKTAVSSWTNQKDLIVAKLGWNGKFRNILSDYFYYLHFLHQFVCSFFIWYEIAKLACFCKKDFPSVIESLFSLSKPWFLTYRDIDLVTKLFSASLQGALGLFLSFFYLHFSSEWKLFSTRSKLTSSYLIKSIFYSVYSIGLSSMET